MPRRAAAVAIGLGLVLVIVALPGCASGGNTARAPRGDDPAVLTVFAAASLTGAFTELGETFEAARPGTTVRFNFGSSAALAQQITQGAPADVFAAASPATMRTVTAAALAGPPVTFARNRLEIAVPAAGPTRVDALEDLADPRVKVALCARQVPCGAAAADALDAAGLTVTPVTLEQDVKATLTKVELGEVDAALVYRTDVLASDGKVRGIPFPEAGQAINDYPIAVLHEAPAPGPARRFVELVRAAQGRAVLTEAGFEVP
jgi:molybdate transport system substrate-binding protein